MNTATSKIMIDRGAWKFTDDLIVRIKRFDVAAMTEFYNTNYTLLLKMARKFVWKQRNIYNNFNYTVDDVMQQVFVDLPYYNFSSRSALYCCIARGSFLQSTVGGITVANSKSVKPWLTFSYDAPVNGFGGNASYLLDKFVRSPSPHEELYANEEREAKDNAILAFLERTVKNKKDLNKIFCGLFLNIPLNEIEGNEYERFKQCQNNIS